MEIERKKVCINTTPREHLLFNNSPSDSLLHRKFWKIPQRFKIKIIFFFPPEFQFQ